MIPILVISPEEGTLTFLASLLRKERFRVEAVPSVERGVQYLVHHTEPRVVLVDVTMPIDPLMGFLTIVAATPTLRTAHIYAGVGAIALQIRGEAVSLMEVIGMELLDLTRGDFPLNREVTRLALRLQRAS